MQHTQIHMVRGGEYIEFEHVEQTHSKEFCHSHPFYWSECGTTLVKTPF